MCVRRVKTKRVKEVPVLKRLKLEYVCAVKRVFDLACAQQIKLEISGHGGGNGLVWAIQDLVDLFGIEFVLCQRSVGNERQIPSVLQLLNDFHANNPP
jgi:hypothetical protein